MRSRKRIYPPKPRIGLRATKPNEYWHVDTTLIRLVDGSRVYLQAVLDNYSRRILAWRLSERFDTTITAAILQEAAKALPKNTVPSAVMDSGVENVNTKVNELVSEGTIKRILAQVDIAQSNSMIEAWWRQLKHQWLFLNELDSATSVRKLVGFYVEQHNTVVPHFAFEGQTPDERYFGTGASVPATLKQKRDQARTARPSTQPQGDLCAMQNRGYQASDGSILLSTFYNPLSSRPAARRVLEHTSPDCPAAPDGLIAKSCWQH